MTAHKIPIMVPENLWGHLATLAERRHTDIPTLINHAVEEWLRRQKVDLRSQRQRDRASRYPKYLPGSPIDVLAEEIYEARQERKRKTA